MKIIGQDIPSVGIGNIIIPTGVIRDDYVNTCYKRERVSILPTGGCEMIKDCYITISTLKDVEFPINSDELGVTVCYVIDKLKSKPIIIGTISKESESQLLSEYDIQIIKKNNNNIVGVTANAKNGHLGIFSKNTNGTSN
ncbi:MAG: hypothetical protein OEL54_05890, partial [Flavobacteriaceae bacterium]|nr:hypothetical protein [Flavobacteriaceae bacterium]